MVYTFDIFDTVITRKTAVPKGVFAIMQKELTDGYKEVPLSEDVRSQFFKCRVEAELNARKKARESGREEVTITDIYECFQITNGVDDDTAQRLSQIEIEMEYQLLQPIRENVIVIEELSERAECYFISDMYLPLPVVRKMLLLCSPAFEKIPIFLSCETGKTKHSGTLYDYFIKTKNINVMEWVHLGDNEYSDVQMVFRKGGTGKLYKSYSFSAFEKKLLKTREGDEKLQLTVGTVKNICTRESRNESYAEVGIRVGGPILYGYVLWVVQDCLRRGISQLCFIARDGYILKKIADIIIENRQLELQTFYLYGSRKAWRVPAICQSTESIRDWLLEKCCFSNLAELSDALAVPQNYLLNYLPAHLSSADRFYSEYEQKFIKSKLANSSEILEYVQKTGLKKRERVLGYLRQELPEDMSRMVFVELNGSGYTQWCLNRLINNSSKFFLMTYYYILIPSSDIILSGIGFSEYLHESFEGNDDILEILARAPHGQTADYRLEGKKWEPVLEEEVNDFPKGNDYREYLQGVLDFAHEISRVPCGMRYNYNSVALKYLKQLYYTSDKKILDFIGDMPFATNSSLKNKAATYAPKLSTSDMRNIYLKGNHDRRIVLSKYYNGNNLHFSELRMSREERIKQYVYKCIGEIIKRIPAYKTDRNCTRVIIYGAGIIGKRIYQDARKSGIRVVLWVDKNYMNIHDTLHKIEDPCKVIRYDYDFIIIAIKSAKVVNEVRIMLQQIGVPEEKIV